MKDIKQRILTTFSALLILFTAGVIGYVLIEKWDFLDSLYMTVITLATIGYGEVHPLSQNGRIFTIFLILGGIGTMTYIFSSITALLIEGELKDVFRRIKMQNTLEHIKDHYIVCGATHAGISICEELSKTDRPFALIVLKEEEVRKFMDAGYCVVAGDASTDEALLKCSISKARGIFCALKNDKDNAFIALTARGLAQGIKIVTVQNENDPKMQEKLARSGADIVISPSHIGGLRMVSEMTRPATVQFLDSMMRGKSVNCRFEDIEAGAGANGKTLAAFKGADKAGALVVAVKSGADGGYEINPLPSRTIKKGEVLVALGTPEEVARLRELLG
ncbi:MAG: NAD-binding protein [Elusimicrobia bacterium]|nr:NAD-binding protein [Elusimicrobiota bacterium]